MPKTQKNFPSMRALVAFAAAARLGSFSRAGDELGMTQSAVSHQMRALEDHLRQPLFNRLHRNAVLTDAGRDLEATLMDCFERLELGLKRLEQYRKPNQVIVYAPAAFASHWLVPRLPRLRAAIGRFAAHREALKPHFAYGVLDKGEYTLAHTLHIANHQDQIVVA